MIGLLAAFVLALASCVYAAPIRISGSDVADQSTGTATDSLEFTEILSGGAVDADARLQTTLVHNAANGGTDASAFAMRFERSATGRVAAYKWLTDLNPTDTSYAVSKSFHLATAPAAGLRSTIWAMREGSDTDLGCAVVVDSTRALTLTYIGTDTTSCVSDAGCSGTEWCYAGFCRPKWGTTASNTLSILSCATDRRLGCLTSADCPSSGACNQTHWGGLELNQVNQGDNVICELYSNGKGIMTGVPLDPPGTPVGGVTNDLWGALPGETTALPVLYADDAVADDSGLRAGYGYVFRKVPAADGTRNINWALASACGGKFQCLDDYVVGSFLFDSGAVTNNAVRGANVNRIQDFLAAAPTITLGAGEVVTAIEAVVAGATGTLASTPLRELQLSILTCPPCTSSMCVGTGDVCSTSEDCCQPQDSNTVTLLDDATPRLLHRYLSVTSPISGSGAWNTHLNELGIRLNTKNTPSARYIYAGAQLLYGFVRKPDLGEALTLRDHNKGTDDGLVTICAVGDSTAGGTLEATCQGGSNTGIPCSFEFYCSYDLTNKDQPPGGCTNDAMCKRCTGNTNLICSTPGTTECDLGTCTGGFCTGGDGETACTGNCNFGSCDTAATCIESCPDSAESVGTCPTDRAGWPAALIALQPNVFLNCPFGAEDTGQMYTNRFAKIMDGEGSAVSACQAVIGAGTCAVGGAACTSVDDCTSGGICQFPKCDYIVLLEGYNDVLQYPLYQANVSWKGWHDPECETAEGFVSAQGLVLQTDDQPTKHCPQFGASGYARPLTTCGRQADCAGISGTSDCYGVCATGTQAKHCSVRADCGASSDCTVHAEPCSSNAECGLRACSVNDPWTPGAAPRGVCQCTSDADCGSTSYRCVGEAGGKRVCRRRRASSTATDCAVDADCGSYSTCDTTTCDTAGRCTDTSVNFCRGRCTVPCNAISCSQDSQCGKTTITARWGGLIQREIAGTCNKAIGKCSGCGTFRCGEDAAILTRGCSCTVATQTTDCGSGGVCDPNYGTCTSGTPAARTDCRLDSECATGRQCMRLTAQQRRWEVHEDLLKTVVQRMVADIAALADSTPPVLIVSEIPLTNGRVAQTTIPDRGCVGAWPDRSYYANSKRRLLEVLPANRVVDQSEFNAGRMATAYHSTDMTHFNPAGGAKAGEAIVTQMRLLNVCVTTATGLVQKYCKNANGTFETTTCTSNGECNVDETCERRVCNGSEANCPAAGDSCNLD